MGRGLWEGWEMGVLSENGTKKWGGIQMAVLFIHGWVFFWEAEYISMQLVS